MHGLIPGPAITYLKPLCTENPESCLRRGLSSHGKPSCQCVSGSASKPWGSQGPSCAAMVVWQLSLVCPHYTLIEETFHSGEGLLAEHTLHHVVQLQRENPSAGIPPYGPFSWGESRIAAHRLGRGGQRCLSKEAHCCSRRCQAGGVDAFW